MIDKTIKNEILTISIGSLLFNVIVLIFLLILYFTNLLKIDIIHITVGLLIGFIISIIYTYHMGMSLNKSVDFPDEKSSQSYYTKQKLFRDSFLIIFFIVLCKFVDTTIAVFSLIGLFGVKFGAYISPIIKKYINIICKK